MNNSGFNQKTTLLQKKYIHSLTALRFFFAAGIVLFHLKSTMPKFFNYSYFDNFANGVDFFFILSGFILSYNYQSTNHLKLKDFYIKRFARIYPLHLLSFATWCCLFLATWYVPITDKILSGIANITLTHTFFPGFLFSLGYNAVSWSLANEAFFYVAFPFVRQQKVSILITGIVFIYFIVSQTFSFQGIINPYFPNFNYFFPLVRIAEFCCGILAANFYHVRLRLPYATFWEGLLIFLSIFQLAGYGLTQSQEVIRICSIITFTGLIWIFAHEQGLISKYLANQRVLILLGEASFSLYMWHHMILRYCGENFPLHIPSFIVVSIAITISIFISIFSFNFFEQLPRKFIIARVVSKT